jgi:hypothetical protein
MLEKQVTAHSRLLTCCELCCLLRHPRGCINISDNHLPCHGLHLQAAAVLATQRNVAVQLVHQHRPAIEMLCMELLDKKVRSGACHGVPSEQHVHVLMAQLCADGSTLCLSCGMVHHWLCTLPSPSAGAACSGLDANPWLQSHSRVRRGVRLMMCMSLSCARIIYFTASGSALRTPREL